MEKNDMRLSLSWLFSVVIVLLIGFTMKDFSLYNYLIYSLLAIPFITGLFIMMSLDQIRNMIEED